MNFTEIIGQNQIKKHLISSTENGRIPHAQLFVSKTGTGALAMATAYAQHLICSSKEEGKDLELCKTRCSNIEHPDIHFSFPFVNKKNATTSDFYFDMWKKFIKENPYGSYNDWLNLMDVKNQQPLITVKEGENIAKKLVLKAYDGGYKVIIIWMAEKLNTEASNKLLKLIEEPPKKTVFILITENEEQILQTIKSRCQAIHFNNISEIDIKNALIEKYKVEEKRARIIAKLSNGNLNKAIDAIEEKEEDKLFDQWFVQWVRSAFMANKKATVVSELIRWSEKIADIGRESQKLFLQHCLEIFRQALLLNYNSKELVYFESKEKSFKLEKFAPFITPNNINEIYNEINDTIYHIERNGNAKLLFTDLSIKLTKLIHKK